MCLTSHDNFQYHNQSVDTDNITLERSKEKYGNYTDNITLERSKEKYGNYTDNIILLDQRKNMEIILTILLCEIKGKVWKLY
jgi:hypothetical protein